MEDPLGTDPWNTLANDTLGIHRPTSAPPAMELNAADLSHPSYSGLDPAYFTVAVDASAARDYADSGAYLNGNATSAEDFGNDARSAAARDAYAQHPAYAHHMMQQAHHAHMGYPMATHNGQQPVGYYGMPGGAASAHAMAGNASHMSGHYPGMYGYPYGPAPDAMYRGNYPYAYPAYGPHPEVYGYPQMSSGGPIGQRAQSVGAAEVDPSTKTSNGSNHPHHGSLALPIGARGGHGNAAAYGNGPNPAYTASLGLSASPPSDLSGWNKSSPRGKRTKALGAKGEPSLSSSTEDLLSLAGKPHLMSGEFTGSMTELPSIAPGGSASVSSVAVANGSSSSSPHSPRSPQHARKHIKVQQRSANGAVGAKNGGLAVHSQMISQPHGGSADASMNSAELRSSHPMPIGWGAGGNNGAASNAGADDFGGLMGGLHIAPSLQQQEFVMGSGSPILARMHHPGMANGNAAPGAGSHSVGGSSGSNSSSGGGSTNVCHYYPVGLCGKGDKCRYAHVDDGDASSGASSNGAGGRGGSQNGTNRRTPRAPTQVISFGAESNATAQMGAHPQHMHHQHASAPLMHASAIGQSPHMGSMGGHHTGLLPAHMVGPQSHMSAPGLMMHTQGNNATLSGSGNVAMSAGNGASNAMNSSGGSNSSSGAQGSGSSSGANAANSGSASLASMRYSNTTLEECVGQIFLMCKDQYGCRYLQKKLDEDKTSGTCDMIFEEIVGEVVELMSDPFGNYLCQKLIEKCSPTQRLAIVRGVSGSLVQISKNMHGTRAVQKTIEQLGSPEEIRLIRDALKGSVVALIQDLNGNHVIQKCIHRLEPNDNQFIYDAVAHHCVQVATHRHGCCVMQRCIDHSSNQQKMQLIGEIRNNALSLVQDQFGNYVVQYVLDLGLESVCESLAANLLGNLYFLSTQKFSSNVVEKCLEVGNAATVQMMSRELAEFQADPNRPLFPQTPNEDPLICLLQHPFGNYVVQTALQVAQTKAPKEWHMIAARIKPHLPSLRSNTYVKRVQGLLAQAQVLLPGAASPTLDANGVPIEDLTSSDPAMVNAAAAAAAAGAIVSPQSTTPTSMSPTPQGTTQASAAFITNGPLLLPAANNNGVAPHHHHHHHHNNNNNNNNHGSNHGTQHHHRGHGANNRNQQGGRHHHHHHQKEHSGRSHNSSNHSNSSGNTSSNSTSSSGGRH